MSILPGIRWSSAPSIRRNISICSRCRRQYHTGSPIREGETAILINNRTHRSGKELSTAFLTRPLTWNKSTKTPGGVDLVRNQNIIGKREHQFAFSKKGQSYTIRRPALAEYVDLSQRLVTPVYSQDANLIVSLLDLHPAHPKRLDDIPTRPAFIDDAHHQAFMRGEAEQRVYSESQYTEEAFGEAIAAGTLHPDSSCWKSERIESVEGKLDVSAMERDTWEVLGDGAEAERIEIFEAGTGHGSLTLHLSRAIHAANTSPPEDPILSATAQKAEEALAPEPREDNAEAITNAENEDESPSRHDQEAQDIRQWRYDRWRSSRNAVIHTLDISSGYSKHAEGVVRNFRNGMYSSNIDFHVGTIEGYLTPRLEAEQDVPFLSHAILDLPACEGYLDILSMAMKPGGTLITWTPSITQVMRCLETVRDHDLDWALDKVLEVGKGIGSGGREWDVRFVRPKERTASPQNDMPVSSPSIVEHEDPAISDEQIVEVSDKLSEAVGSADGAEGSVNEASTRDTKIDWQWVCRPKVGIRSEGGGFIGVWKKLHRRSRSPAPASSESSTM